jgi:hypothetical protein
LYEVAFRMAEKTGGKYFLLPAPLLAHTSEERTQWCHHRLYRVLQSLSSQADVVFLGIGEIGIGCPLHRDGFIEEEEVAEIINAGAVYAFPVDCSDSMKFLIRRFLGWRSPSSRYRPEFGTFMQNAKRHVVNTC